MKVGDPVIVYKPIWMNNKPKRGKLVEIFELDSRVVYRVYFYDKMGRYKDGCNIFTDNRETIELDIEIMREEKLKSIGL